MKSVVIGGGVIGTTTAYYLAKLGHEVELIERREDVARETSFGNGGVLHSSECEPWSRPGMVRNVIKWLGKESAPLLLRYSAIPKMWRWGLAFAGNCNLEDYRRNTRANLRLSLLTLQSIAEIRAETELDYDMRSTGTMKIYTAQKALDTNAREAEYMRPHGMQCEVLDAAGAVAREPALASARDGLVGALYFPPDESGDCQKFTVALRKHAETLGVRFRFGTEIAGFDRASDRVAAAVTTTGEHVAADNYVVALGSHTPALMRTVGVRIPIYPVKGVTITVPSANWPERLNMPIIDDTRLFGLATFGDRLRASGSAEIAGFDTTPSRARCQAIVDNVTAVFPDFARCYDPATALYWAGLRPMTPTGTPCLGKTRLSNLFVNAGHGHLGWTMSCGSARVVSNLVAGGDPGIDLDRLALDQR